MATIAVESYLTRLFLKLKGMENYAITFNFQTSPWKHSGEENTRRGGFLKPRDFVAKRFTWLTIDQFVVRNNIVASQLSVSEATVKGHMKSILSKLGVNDRTHAVTIAMKRAF